MTGIFWITTLAAAALLITGCETESPVPNWNTPMPVEDAYQAAKREYKRHPPRYAVKTLGTPIQTVGSIHSFADPTTALLASRPYQRPLVACRTEEPSHLANFELNQAVIAMGRIEIPEDQILPITQCTLEPSPRAPGSTKRPPR